jgi:hypothetical protein
MAEKGKRNYMFGLELSVSCVLSVEERDKLVNLLMETSKKMAEIIGEHPISGVANVYSKRK